MTLELKSMDWTTAAAAMLRALSLLLFHCISSLDEREGNNYNYEVPDSSHYMEHTHPPPIPQCDYAYVCIRS